MSQPTIKYLKDYQQPSYWVDTIDLTFTLNDNKTVTVISTTSYYKNINSGEANLVLDGSAQLISLALNDIPLTETEYYLNIAEEQLTLTNLPERFTLSLTTLIEPWQNQSCMGLYASRNNLLTQCEPEGFRKITYYLDRPDIMASFSTTIIAPQNQYSTLLSNGNKVQESITGNQQKVVKWVDPFKKPSYLFALVVGNFECLSDYYITQTGREVRLEIYTETGQSKRCVHALESLKRAMRWDETRFDLEYDLANYMIVVTNDFNMGAMENKGLNIFNAKYVLADKDTATDSDFINVEAVIGHEYFHNWTGNRVTCRDWFQLSLKEGLTVFREHEFSADMHNRSVKRITEAKRLRQLGFTEDAGPLAHPVRPESYMEINNFYTVTIYEKGQEVVRMYQTILGQQGFNKGFKLYLKRHDGTAATCDNFCQAMAEGNDFDLNQFMLWYSQAGTPQIKAKASYDPDTKEYTLLFEQTIPDTPGQPNKQPMLIPIKLGLLDKNGHELTNLEPSQGQFVRHESSLVLLLTQQQNKFVFKNIAQKPIPSLLREFSAPVKLEFELTNAERLVLINHDSDEFNCWENLTILLKDKVQAIYTALLHKKAIPLFEAEFWLTLRNLLNKSNLAPEFRALAFTLPSFTEMLTEIKEINPVALTNAINYLEQQIGTNLFDTWIEVYNLSLSMHYEFKDHGKRSLKNIALSYILKGLAHKLDNPRSLQLIETLVLGQYHNADNMTDSIAVLFSMNNLDIALRDLILQEFYSQWQDNELVMDKWFAIQASSNLISIDKLNKLMVDKAFVATNPNKIYALLRSFTLNGLKFNSEEGYSFIADKIIVINKFNPQVASTLAHGFSNVVYLHAHYRQMAKVALQRVLNQPDLSNDVYEITSKIIAGLN